MKSRQKKWRDSRSRETNGGEKIAVTSLHVVISKSNNSGKVEGLKMLHLKYIYIFLKEQALIHYLAKSGVCTHISATPLVG